jgi:hypothetical protein
MAQKFRSIDCNGTASILVEFGDEKVSESKNLDIYSKFGTYISDQTVFHLPSEFESIYISIFNDKKEKIKGYHIPSSDYRILNSKNCSTDKLVLGENSIVVSKGVSVNINDGKLSSECLGNLRDLYYFNCTENTVITIGNKKLHLSSNNIVDVDFEYAVDRNKCYTVNF